MEKLWILVGTGIACFLLGGTVSWQVQGWRFDAAEKERIEQEAKQAVRRADKANTASGTFENKRGKNDVRYQTIVKEVQTFIDRPVYVNACLDADGLRALNAQIRRDADPGQPRLTMPKPSGTGRSDGQGLDAVGDGDSKAVSGLPRQGAGIKGWLAKAGVTP